MHGERSNSRINCLIEKAVSRWGENDLELARHTFPKAWHDVARESSEAQARALYPATWDRWKAQYRRFNATGTFDGKVTDRLGISVRPRG